MRALLRPLLPTAAAAALLLAAGVPAAGAHGGITVAEGERGGTRIVVQGSEAHTDRGAAVDLSTVLDGPGTGPRSRVVYWVRTAAGRTFRVRTDRDASGTHHAEVLVAGRGTWQDWDVSAMVTLSTGRTLRVTNAKGDPPGPKPAAPPTPTTTSAAGETSTAGGTDVGPEAATTPSTGDDAVEDVSGDGDGPPGWAIPSIAVVVVAAIGFVLLRRRSRGAR